MKGLLKVGGMIFGMSCMNFYEGECGGVENIVKILYGYKIDGVIVIGGEGIFVVVDCFVKDGIKVIGVFKMIDNDL